VAVQEARVANVCLRYTVASGSREVKSGAYGSHLGAHGRAASIDVCELYDGKERLFLVLVYVPRAWATEEVTCLVKASCTCREAATATGQTIRKA
jgi:hypothetical protein